MPNAQLLAMGAILLWASLAPLGVQLAHLPPFWLTGVALLVGSVLALPLSRFDPRQWRVPMSTLIMGVYGLFGFHFLLFIALRYAPPVQANLVNYLWPLGIVVMAPLFLRDAVLRPQHVMAALMGFAGAALAITGGRSLSAEWAWGYVPALGSAFIWASYSLLTRRVAHFPTAAIGGFAFVSGLLALACHWLWEPAVHPTATDWLLVVVMGLGPLGGAFFLWDAALKRGNAQHIGLLSFLTPLLSTMLLLWLRGQALSWPIALAAVLIVGAALVGQRR